MSIGLIIGRFQPFHLGHLSAVKQALKQADKLYIAIGSAQYSGRPKNPFTAKERRQMIELALESENIAKDCDIFEVPDIHDDEKWISHLKSIVPDFDIVFVGNNGLVQELFEKNGIPTMPVTHEKDISGTEVRKLMTDNKAWQKMLSPAVAGYIEKLSESI